jgi:hypothetical protein
MGRRRIGSPWLAGLLGLALLTGCASNEKMNASMNTWIGEPVQVLAETWGPPTRTMDDGSGGKIVIYEYVRSQDVPENERDMSAGTEGEDPQKVFNPGGVAGTLLPSATAKRTVWRMFHADAGGVIRSWAWKGR